MQQLVRAGVPAHSCRQMGLQLQAELQAFNMQDHLGPPT